MDKLTKQIIRCKVMQYPYLRNKITNEIAEVCEKGKGTEVSGGYSSARNASGFDERLAKIMSKQDYLWCKAVEAAIGYFNERGREEVVNAVEGLYWKGQLNADGVARVLHVSRAQVYFYIDDLFEMIHKYAISNGVCSIN